MKNRPHWNLGGKIALVAAPFLALALISITTTLWVCCCAPNLDQAGVRTKTWTTTRR
jgi:hypothetical protein